jgi:hypothetical protein
MLTSLVAAPGGRSDTLRTPPLQAIQILPDNSGVIGLAREGDQCFLIEARINRAERRFAVENNCSTTQQPSFNLSFAISPDGNTILHTQRGEHITTFKSIDISAALNQIPRR